MGKRKLAIIGGGSAGLALACFLDSGLYDVTIYERNVAVGRKFLVAGKGGFNLTHSEHMDSLIQRYAPEQCMNLPLSAFTNEHFRAWLLSIGIPTFVGSSGRVFPVRGTKPIEVLNAITDVLSNKRVVIENRMMWMGWNQEGNLLFENGTIISPDVTVFALGGASWQRTGSDGVWLPIFQKRQIPTTPFEPANVGYLIAWPDDFINKCEGLPLKNIAVRTQKLKKLGELLITKKGLEGSAIYYLTDKISSQLREVGEAQVYIDLKPSISMSRMKEKLKLHHGSKSDFLRSVVKLEPTKIMLLKSYLSKEQYLDDRIMIQSIKALPLKITGTDVMDKAISTVGGVCSKIMSDDYQITELKDTYAIGEMLDWNAPTGGYLLQACFSMGYHLASLLNCK